MITLPHTWIELSRKAFEHNINTMKMLIGNTMLGVVVKSNAYGHGMKEIAQLCQNIDAVAWLCTASLSEALLLRSIGITKPLLVMTIIDGDPTQAINHDIDLIVSDMQTISMLNSLASNIGKKAAIHIKIDTGMSRFGFYPSQALEIIKKIKNLPFITIRGICTHFSESNSENQDYTLSQLYAFKQLLAALEQEGIDIPIKHASNSAAAAILPEARFNLVRIGAAAYGFWPSQAVRLRVQQNHPEYTLKPIMTWKTRITHIRSLPPQTYVGYTRSYQTNKTTTMGIVPIGYFDGYDRRLSNKGQFLLCDKDGAEYWAPAMGIICMNATMLDISHIPHAQIDSEVIILGDHEKNNAWAIAHDIASFNPREITTRISPEIPRIIVP